MMATLFALILSLCFASSLAWFMYIPYHEENKDMKELDIDTTTIAVTARALAKFKEDYPDRNAVWVKTVQGKLDIKISSVPRKSDTVVMRNHIYFHKTSGLMEI
jgi:hypothetical protein